MLNAQFFNNRTTRIVGILLMFLYLWYPPVQAASEQSGTSPKKITVKGTVLDDAKEPLIGVSVLVKGIDGGTITNVDGKFTIDAPANGVLIFSYIGMDTQEVDVKGRQDIIVTMRSGVVALSDVVVIGYGEASRRTITSSISKVKGDVLNDIPISSPVEGLKGRISGVRVVQTNNTPGGGFSIKVRGGSSITQSNEPLVLVDGVERSMNDISPEDISSIDVLKDAASTAIYGARGSNGVILISTRKGKYDSAPRITFEASVAYQQPETLRDFLNAEEYINVLRPAIAISPSPQWNQTSGYSVSSANTGSSIYSTRYYNEGDVIPNGWKTMPDPLDPSKTLMFCDTDWQGLMFGSALWQNYHLSIDGGSKIIRYNASVGYTDDGGVGLATGYKRFNLKSNAEAKISDNLTANVNVNFQRTSSDAYANQRDAISRGLSATPTQIVYMEDGTPAQGYNATSQTPIFYNYYNDDSNVTKYLSLAGNLKWQILPQWSVNLSGSYYDTTNKQSTFMRSNYYSQAREATSTWTETNRLKTEIYSRYNLSIQQKHNMDVMVGYAYQKRNYERLYAYGTGGSTDKITTIDASPETTGSSTVNQDVEVGFFGRFNYNFKEKYLLTLTGRYDASSKFVKDNRWGFFPGMSAGWIISEEEFMKGIHWLDYLKARFSYGTTGNNGIGVNDALGKYTATYKYNGNAAVRGTTLPNQNLTWETTTQMDLGLELGVLDNRVYLSFDFYNKKTKNLLYDMSLPNTTGYSSIKTNLGAVRYWGYELELTTQNIDSKDFKWESKLVFSHNKNKVLELPNNGMEKNRTGTSDYPIYSNGNGTFFGGLAEGEPLYRFYGYKAIGIYQTDEEAAKAEYDQMARGFNPNDGTTVAGRKFAGDYIWADRNKDGVITKNQDLFCLGTTEPTVTGSIGNTFTYKNWSLNIYLDYALGHSIYDESFSRYFCATFSTNYALAKDVEKCWKQPGDVTRYAKFRANDSGTGQANFNRISNVFTYKGDYLCIRDISLSYQFPKQWMQKINIENLQLTLSGSNLHYFTAVKGISPEIGTASTYNTSYSNYPPVRRLSVAAKVTF